jgi:hypothetical protein
MFTTTFNLLNIFILSSISTPVPLNCPMLSQKRKGFCIFLISIIEIAKLKKMPD